MKMDKPEVGLTIAAMLAFAIEQLSSVDSPRLEAEILLSHLLGVRRSYLLAWSENVLTVAQFRLFQQWVARRVEGEPIAYIVGYKEFWSLPLQVTVDTLIPRPETELLVEQVLARLPVDSQAQVVDLGTGTGAIALALAKERPRCRLIATDISLAALAVAKANAQRLGLAAQIQWIHSDWWTNLGAITATVIVANPPYIAEHDIHLTQGDVRFEPRHALVAGKEGLTAICLLIDHAKSYLSPQGWLLLEHGYLQAQAVQQLFQQQGYQAIETYFDLSGHPRVTVGKC
jgi:release factor glutamine methyltransferase